MSQSTTAILQLPDELLVNVAGGVDVADLHALSLTCRRMRPIAQECLVRRATLSPENAWKLVGMLRSHPDLVASFTYLRLGPIPEVAVQGMHEIHRKLFNMGKGHGAVDTNEMALCILEGMTALFTLAHRLSVFEPQAADDPVRKPNRSSEPYDMLPPSLESVHMLFPSFCYDFPDLHLVDKLIADDVNFPKLRHVQLRYNYTNLSTAWGLCSLPNYASKIPAVLQRWQASRVDFTTAFGTGKFASWGEGQTTEEYTVGDLIPAIKKCLATTHAQLENEPEMMTALGYVARSNQ